MPNRLAKKIQDRIDRNKIALVPYLDTQISENGRRVAMYQFVAAQTGIVSSFGNILVIPQVPRTFKLLSIRTDVIVDSGNRVAVQNCTVANIDNATPLNVDRGVTLSENPYPCNLASDFPIEYQPIGIGATAITVNHSILFDAALAAENVKVTYYLEYERT